MTYVKDGKCVNMLPLLNSHRKSLLGIIRKGQEQIDCLDYLLYKIKKM